MDEFEIHVKNNKAQFNEISEEIMSLMKWKESLTDFNANFINDIKRHIDNTVSKAELVKYNEQQNKLLELKLAEFKDLREQILTREKQSEISSSINELKRLFHSFETELKENVKAIVREEIKRDEVNPNEIRERLIKTENELKIIKKECARLTKENQELNNELSKALSTIEEIHNSDNLEAEFLENINDLKAVVNATVERENSIVKRVTELEEKNEVSVAQTLSNRLEVLEKKLNQSNNRYSLVADTLNKLKLDMNKLESINKESKVVNEEYVVDYEKNSDKQNKTSNYSVNQEDSMKNPKGLTEAVLEDFDEENKELDTNIEDKRLSDFLENLPDAEGTFGSPNALENISIKGKEEGNSFFSEEGQEAKEMSKESDNKWFA